MKLQLRFLYVPPLFVLQMAAWGCNRANPRLLVPKCRLHPW
jgi:hypothetical protein